MEIEAHGMSTSHPGSPTPAEIARAATALRQSNPHFVDALMRIGMDPDRRLRWLLEFVERSVVEPGARQAAVVELTAFVVTSLVQSFPDEGPELERFGKEMRRA